jgi:hypothetical protein
MTHHRPSTLDTTDVLDETGNDLFTLGRVRDLGVELNTEDRLALVGDSGPWGGRGMGDNFEVGR